MEQKTRVRGFSLLEVLIASVILVALLAMVYMSLHKTSDMYSVNSKRAWILHEARAALDEMAEEMRQGNRFSLVPVTATTEGVESAPGTQISFKKITSPDPTTKKTRYNTYYTSYFWQLSDDVYTVADPANTSVIAPAPTPPYKVTGGNWIDVNQNKIKDEGRLMRVDPNPNEAGQYYPAKILSHYLKNTPEGFQIREMYRTVNGVRQYQLRLTLVLMFPDEKNRMQEETVETIVFLRNSQ